MMCAKKKMLYYVTGTTNEWYDTTKTEMVENSREGLEN